MVRNKLCSIYCIPSNGVTVPVITGGALEVIYFEKQSKKSNAFNPCPPNVFKEYTGNQM